MLALPQLDAQVARGSSDRFEPIDIFEIEWASDPQIAPDGRRIVYVRNFMDIMKDRYRSNLWTINTDGSEHRPLTSGMVNHTVPRWSPDGKRLLYTSNESGSPQLHVHWLDSGQSAMLTRLGRAPRQAAWSPDGTRIAFVMSVDDETTPLAKMPKAPEGAEWAKAPKVIESIQYRSDGAGYLEPVFAQIFVMPATGGTPRQLTRGEFHHNSRPVWSADGRLMATASQTRKAAPTAKKVSAPARKPAGSPKPAARKAPSSTCVSTLSVVSMLAWPLSSTSSCVKLSGSPAATRICSFNKSRPVIISVTGCSTCRREFISIK